MSSSFSRWAAGAEASLQKASSDLLERALESIGNNEAVKKLGVWGLALAQMNQDGNVRGGEGMRLAFDQIYALEPSAAKDEAYLPMWESRYTPAVDIGTKYDGAYKLSLIGPHFEELYDGEDESPQPDLEGL